RRAKTVVDDPRRPSRGLRLLPVMIEGTSIDSGAESAEGVPVQVPDPPPIPIADAELVGGAGPTDEVRLIDVEEPQQLHEGRDRSLPHPDRADLGRFDHRDRRPRRKGPCQHAGREPPGGAATDDGDRTDALVVGHVVLNCGTSPRRRSAGPSCRTSMAGWATADSHVSLNSSDSTPT